MSSESVWPSETPWTNICSIPNTQPWSKKPDTEVLTFWCPNSFIMVPSFFVLLWSLWAAMAGLGSLQSMERRWYQRCRPSWMCADLMLGSKRCTSHPLLAMLVSNWLSSLPSLQNKQNKIKLLMLQKELLVSGTFWGFIVKEGKIQPICFWSKVVELLCSFSGYIHRLSTT